jgi:uncharacterized protein YuzE
MEQKTPPRIVDVDRLNGNVLVEFDNGETLIYPPDLLYLMRAQAVQVETESEGDSPLFSDAV